MLSHWEPSRAAHRTSYLRTLPRAKSGVYVKKKKKKPERTRQADNALHHHQCKQKPPITISTTPACDAPSLVRRPSRISDTQQTHTHTRKPKKKRTAAALLDTGATDGDGDDDVVTFCARAATSTIAKMTSTAAARTIIVVCPDGPIVLETLWSLERASPPSLLLFPLPSHRLAPPPFFLTILPALGAHSTAL